MPKICTIGLAGEAVGVPDDGMNENGTAVKPEKDPVRLRFAEPCPPLYDTCTESVELRTVVPATPLTMNDVIPEDVVVSCTGEANVPWIGCDDASSTFTVSG